MGLVQAKWTDQILDEVFRNLAANRPDLDPLKFARTRELMNGAVRDCLVTGYESLVDALDLPDPDDRHVLAAAIKARAQDRDSQSEGLRIHRAGGMGHGGEVGRRLHPGSDRPEPRCDLRAVQRIADSRGNPPATFSDVLAMLERDGLVESVAALRP
ncbi:hypothetical protein GORHZ_074_00115 [Gordonia rhizosphera NBRC 16068]|uniref:VapC50 C-terminal domain-containing protein n=1 Tax=Gordonia rhizosphera NBRC 16068 TaxID=1108045 RepID=K6WCJ1_9ACTN|nr:hypothetical protein [Gordonia rhizosphera]GAB89902.1 hypothetical protein GORHZ_074_00115 [Gordonia rhizosphera NBRC 16068]